jgi:hypothetical protein
VVDVCGFSSVLNLVCHTALSDRACLGHPGCSIFLKSHGIAVTVFGNIQMSWLDTAHKCPNPARGAQTARDIARYLEISECFLKYRTRIRTLLSTIDLAIEGKWIIARYIIGFCPASKHDSPACLGLAHSCCDWIDGLCTRRHWRRVAGDLPTGVQSGVVTVAHHSCFNAFADCL